MKKLTLTRKYGDENKIRINTDLLEFYELVKIEGKRTTAVHIATFVLFVKETPEEIDNLIDAALTAYN